MTVTLPQQESILIQSQGAQWVHLQDGRWVRRRTIAQMLVLGCLLWGGAQVASTSRQRKIWSTVGLAHQITKICWFNILHSDFWSLGQLGQLYGYAGM
jgi:hypothetical protein